MITTSRMTARIITAKMKSLLDPIDLFVPVEGVAEAFDGASVTGDGGTCGATAITGAEDLACKKGRGGTCDGADSARL